MAISKTRQLLEEAEQQLMGSTGRLIALLTTGRGLTKALVKSLRDQHLNAANTFQKLLDHLEGNTKKGKKK